MIDGQNFLDEPVKNNIRSSEDIITFEIQQLEDYITGCLLDYPYLKSHYEMMAINLSKQQALDGEPRAMQRTNFKEYLARQESSDTTMLSITEEPKGIISYFSKGTMRVLQE